MTTTPPQLDHAREELTSAKTDGAVEIVETAASL
jgi:hypothetical protein